ncbi:MAG TPA: tryptophan-rich sensory protein [Candidatus Hydrogenedentes bacterium]|nr:tryptophan-rich sensory protein [Candidatus Hydrogenedentota bacterium]
MRRKERRTMSGWYDALVKPAYNPPAWIFGPVWTALYIMMAAAFVVFALKCKGRTRWLGLTVYTVNIMANLLWTPLFFRWHLIGVAFVDCFFIAASAWFVIVWFWRATRVGALLLIPYALWTSFASVLNFHLWFLNR